MSLRTSTYFSLDQKLKDFFERSGALEKCKSLRDQVLDSSNFPTDQPGNFVLLGHTRKLPEKVLLGLLRWYTSEEVGAVLDLFLEETWGPDHLELKECILTSKEMALGAILEQDLWSDRDFYGNILVLDHLKRFLKLFSFASLKNKVPRRTDRKRGYRDHGSLRLPHDSEPYYPSRKLLTVDELEEIRESQEKQIQAFKEKVLLRLGG